VKTVNPHRPTSAALPVELPGIEPASKIALTCGNAVTEYAKRRESTGKYLRLRERC